MIKIINKYLITPFLFILVIPAAFLSMAKQAEAAPDAYIKPVAGSITLRFTAKYRDETGRSRTHHGIDIDALTGSAVRASATGKVMFAGKTPLGLCATVLHPSGVKTTYLPLDRLDVAKGDKVIQGQRLGFLAAAGDISGKKSHLHMGAVFAGEYINPEDLFSGAFAADFSKLIRRANIPPAGSAVSGGFLGSGITHFSLLSYVERLFSGGTNLLNRFWDFLGKSGTYLSRQAVSIYKYGKKQFRSYLLRIHPWNLLRSSSPMLNSGFGSLRHSIYRNSINLGNNGTVVFDPSGDKEGPAGRVSIPPIHGQAVVSVDIFNNDAGLVRHIDGWEASYEGITWTGDDNLGRIVGTGGYSVAVKTAGGQVSVFAVEVRWHLN